MNGAWPDLSRSAGPASIAEGFGAPISLAEALNPAALRGDERIIAMTNKAGRTRQ
jgi:hypothetical protein